MSLESKRLLRDDYEVLCHTYEKFDTEHEDLTKKIEQFKPLDKYTNN